MTILLKNIIEKFELLTEYLVDHFTKPTAEIYTSIAPDFIEAGITNFFRNLNELDNTANQLLQGRPLLAINDFSRF